MKKIKILIPVYNDWKSVFKLLENIDLQITEWEAEVFVLIVNDASTEERLSLDLNFKKVKSIKILNMKENSVGAGGFSLRSRETHGKNWYSD